MLRSVCRICEGLCLPDGDRSSAGRRGTLFPKIICISKSTIWVSVWSISGKVSPPPSYPPPLKTCTLCPMKISAWWLSVGRVGSCPDSIMLVPPPTAANSSGGHSPRDTMHMVVLHTASSVFLPYQRGAVTSLGALRHTAEHLALALTGGCPSYLSWAIVEGPCGCVFAVH